MQDNLFHPYILSTSVLCDIENPAFKQLGRFASLAN